MNVGQVIEQLKNYPPDLPVVISGYEGGVDDVDGFERIKIVLNHNDVWYYGKHEDAMGIYGPDADKLKASAVDALRIH